MSQVLQSGMSWKKEIISNHHLYGGKWRQTVESNAILAFKKIVQKSASLRIVFSHDFRKYN